MHHRLPRSLSHAPDGSSFVTHSMVVEPALMAQFLAQLSRPGQPHSWPWAILAAIAPGDLQLGFSEYASYGSWVLQEHPGAQHIAASRTWLRWELGGWGPCGTRMCAVLCVRACVCVGGGDLPFACQHVRWRGGRGHVAPACSAVGPQVAQ
jgi:hypothetical protein